MGASGWFHSITYQPDIAAALHQLRQEVFDRADYLKAKDLDPNYALTEEEFRASLDPRHDETGLNEYWLEDWQRAQHDGRAALVRSGATDLDSLLASQPHSGTHSIIDMRRVSEEPATAAVSPLTAEQTLAYFGSSTPTTDQVTAWLPNFELSQIRDRWQGVYAISYKDGRPDQIHFAGFSGD